MTRLQFIKGMILAPIALLLGWNAQPKQVSNHAWTQTIVGYDSTTRSIQAMDGNYAGITLPHKHMWVKWHARNGEVSSSDIEFTDLHPIASVTKGINA